MLMVLPLKLLNWLMLGDCFGLFPWGIKVIHVLYIKARSSTRAWSHSCLKALLRLQGECLFCTPDPSNLKLHPKIPPKFFLLSKKITSSAGCLLSGHRFLTLQVKAWAEPSVVGREDVLQSSSQQYWLSLKAHLVHVCWAQHLQCGNSKEAQAEREMSDFWVPVVCSHEV